MRQGGRYGAALAARPLDLKLGDVSATIGFVDSFRRGWKFLKLARRATWSRNELSTAVRTPVFKDHFCT